MLKTSTYRIARLGLIVLFATRIVGATTIDFESLSNGDTVGSNYAALGATFTNAVVITAGIDLNEAEFPPHSGTNVALDAGGIITIQFSSLADSISGYFTYASPLLLTAYDGASTAVRTATSLFSANYVSSGNAPNEFIQINYAAGIDHITIVGDPAGGSFVVDDFSFHFAVVSGAPEPAGSYLVGIALFALSAVALRRSWASQSSRSDN